MVDLYDALLDGLSSRWKAPQEPRSKRAYRCTCGRPVFFLNSRCLGCEAPLGYEPLLGEVRALEPGASPDTWQPSGMTDAQDYRRCANFDSPAGCNWLTPAADPEALCLSCRLNRTIPDLDDEENRRYWQEIEAEKRRLVSQLLGVSLPVVSKEVDPDAGLAFDLLRSPTDGPRVMTGHADGLVTINIEEADDAERERIRTELHEPYRTLLGHLRHEVGHYYWDRLIRGTPWLEPFRELFGDERADYAQAIQENYEKGPPPDWSERHISAYASAHPWEDWAETWAHFLHIMDSLDTALSLGVDANELDLDPEPFRVEDLYDPTDPYAERAILLINSWTELVMVCNELARSMGQPDFYPFVMSKAVVKKLHFIALVVRQAAGTR